MKRIFKYRLDGAAQYRTEGFSVGRSFVIMMPAGAEVLSAGMDGAEIAVWAVVDTEAPPVPVSFSVLGTGLDVRDDGRFIGTVRDGAFVWHVFAGPQVG